MNDIWPPWIQTRNKHQKLNWFKIIMDKLKLGVSVFTICSTQSYHATLLCLFLIAKLWPWRCRHLSTVGARLEPLSEPGAHEPTLLNYYVRMTNLSVAPRRHSDTPPNSANHQVTKSDVLAFLTTTVALLLLCSCLCGCENSRVRSGSTVSTTTQIPDQSRPKPESSKWQYNQSLRAGAARCQWRCAGCGFAHVFQNFQTVWNRETYCLFNVLPYW